MAIAAEQLVKARRRSKHLGLSLNPLGVTASARCYPHQRWHPMLLDLAPGFALRMLSCILLNLWTARKPLSRGWCINFSATCDEHRSIQIGRAAGPGSENRKEKEVTARTFDASSSHASVVNKTSSQDQTECRQTFDPVLALAVPNSVRGKAPIPCGPCAHVET